MLQADDAIDILGSYLSKNGLKMTSQRRLVTEVFFDPNMRDSHPTVEDLFLRVREIDQRVGYATVYRTLKLLTDCNLASPSRFGENQTRYEPEQPGEHHDHLVCVVCNQIIEFEDEQIEALQEEVAARFGLILTDHKMVLFGKPAPGSKPQCNCPEPA